MRILSGIFVIVMCVLIFSGTNATENKSLSETGLDPFKKTTLYYANPIPAPDKHIVDGGFFLHLTGFIPFKNYMWPKKALGDRTSNYKFGFGGGLELGGLFQVKSEDNWGIGLRITWLSVNYCRMKVENIFGTYIFHAVGGSVLKLGPSFTLGIGDEVAFDIFYQASPAFIGSFGDNHDEYYLGLNHAFGLTLRYDIFSIGADFNFGNLINYEYIDETNETIKDLARNSGSSMRILLGFKF